MSSKLFWYFAYGNNMNPRILEERGINPTRSIIAKAPSMRIAFEMVSLYRPGTGDANIRHLDEKENVPEIWGVLHLIDDDTLIHLDIWEAVDTGHYRREEIETIDEHGLLVKAFAYKALHVNQNLLPSEQYLSNIIAGAKYFNLPTKYLSFLENYEVYQ